MLGTPPESPTIRNSTATVGSEAGHVAGMPRCRSAPLVEQGRLRMKCGKEAMLLHEHEQLHHVSQGMPRVQKRFGFMNREALSSSNRRSIRRNSCPFSFHGKSRFFDRPTARDEPMQRCKDQHLGLKLPDLPATPSCNRLKRLTDGTLPLPHKQDEDGPRFHSQRRNSTPAIFFDKHNLVPSSTYERSIFPGNKARGLTPVRKSDLASKNPEADPELTDQQNKFSAAVAEVREKHQMKMKDDGHGMIAVRAYLDARDYDMELGTDKRRPEPGSIQLIYMFYSRIYEKLIGKQKGIEVNLFASLDLSAKCLGFHAILDFAHDFKLIPARTNRHELERIFATVVAGDGGPEGAQKKFESNISYHQFVDLLALCTEGGEPMDRSRVDRSTIHAAETRLERVKRLASILGLVNISKVRLALHNAYRDVHFPKLGDGMDFEKEAKAIEIRSRPQRRVEPLPECRRLDRLGEDASSMKYLEHFTWKCKDHDWEEFEVPILDMGSAFWNESSKHCRLTITNRQSFLAHIRLKHNECGNVRLPWEEISLSPGQSVDAHLQFVPGACGEWCGSILIEAEWTAAKGYEKVSVPTYLHVMEPQTADVGFARLPLHASPLRPGSARYACHLSSDGHTKVPVLP